MNAEACLGLRVRLLGDYLYMKQRHGAVFYVVERGVEGRAG